MSKIIEILIVEDEIVIAQDIKGALEDIGYKVLGIAKNYAGALKVFDYENPDLVLLDITLKGSKTGIDVAHYIRKNFNIPFIFVTSHANSATIEKAKVTKPNGYLVKPFNQDDLHAAIEIALFNYNEYKNEEQTVLMTDRSGAFKDSLFLKSAGLFQRLRFNEIVYLEADGAYTNIFTQDKKYVERKLLLDFEQALPKDQFMRVHRSFVVNLGLVTGIKTDSIFMSKGTVPLGRTYREKLLSIM